MLKNSLQTQFSHGRISTNIFPLIWSREAKKGGNVNIMIV